MESITENMISDKKDGHHFLLYFKNDDRLRNLRYSIYFFLLFFQILFYFCF